MIIIMGVPGVGKTSVLNGVMKMKPKYKIVNYGDLMLETFESKYGIKNRDEIRSAPIDLQKEAQKTVINKLSEMQGKIILDTHCSIRTPKGYLPGLSSEFLEMLKTKIEVLVLLSAPTKEIYDRRQKDSTRIREVSMEEIIEHDRVNMAYLAVYSVLTGAPALIVMNCNNKLEDAVNKILLFLND